MQGSIVKRGENSYQISVYNGKDPKTGRSTYIRETFRGSDKAADERRHELINQINKKQYVPPSKLTFGEYLEQWLEAAKNSVSEGTYDNYKTHIKEHFIKDSIGQIKLDKVTAFDIQGYINRTIGSPRADGRPGGVSAKTVKDHLGTIKKALKDACIWGILKNNPAQYIASPKVPKVRMKTYTEEEAVRFLDVAILDRFYLLFLLAIFTGLRQGELRGLTWDDVDLKKCTLSIQQTVRKTGKKAIYKDTKTEESSSLVTIEPEFILLFEAHKEQQAKDRVAYENKQIKGIPYFIEYEDHNLVFSSFNGRPVDLGRLIVHFRQVIDKADLTQIRFHNLRHSCATILIASGVHLKTVQERLRHADIRTTGNIYAHVIPKMQKEADHIMSRALKINKEQQPNNFLN
jgi:integrase